MWQLSRLTFRAVGHADARFAPLTIDFLDPDGLPTNTVLWLENGGGKTTLLSLAFSILRPRTNEFLTAKADRHLHEYVQAGDVAHVVAEWTRPDRDLLGSRATLVTGQVLAWEGLRPTPDEPRRLRRRWYGFRADDTVTFDSLPFDVDGQPSSLQDFCDDVSRQCDARPHLEAQAPTDSQKQWLRWLAARDLPSDVFYDQVRINADEGAIAEAFQFPSGDEFVRWALKTAADPAVANELVAVIGDVRARIQARPALELEQQLCADASAHLEQLAVGHTLAQDASARARQLRTEAGLLAGQFDTSANDHEHAAARLRADAASCDEQSRLANRDDRQASRRANRARQLAANMRLAAAETTVNGARHRQAEAAELVAAWDATGPLTRRGTLSRDLARKRDQLADLDDTLTPLRHQIDQARAQLAGAVHTQQVLQRRRADRATADGADADVALDAALQDARDAATAHQDATARHGNASGQLNALDSEMDRAVERGWLAATDDVDVALDRARQQLQLRTGELEAATAAVHTAEVTAEQASGQARRARADQLQADHVAKVAAADVDQLDQDTAALSADVGLVEATGHDAPDPFASPARVRTRLAQMADQARASAVRQRVEVADHARVGDAIESTGFAPAPEDVEAAVRALQSVGIPAHTGWRFLTESVTGERSAQLQVSAPHLAGGIVVAAQHLAAATDHLADWAQERTTWLPLVVASSSQVLATDAASPPTFTTVAAHPSLHDATSAAELHAELDEQTAAATAAAQRSTDAAARYERTSARLSQLVERWPDPDSVRAAAVTTRDAAEQAASDTRQADELAAIAAEQLSAAQDRRMQAARDVESATTSAQRLSDLAESQQARAGFEGALRAAEQDVVAAARAAAAAESDADAARARQADAQRDGERARQALAQLTALCRRAAVTPAAADHPDDADLDELERAVVELSNQLHRARDEAGLDEAVARLRAELADVDATLADVDEVTVESARRLLVGPDGADATSRDRAARTARTAATDATHAVGVAESGRDTCAATQKQTEGLDARPLPDDWDVPDTAEGLEGLAVTLDGHATDARREQNAADSRAAALREDATDADRACERLRELVGDLAGLDDVTVAADQSPFVSDVTPAVAARSVREGLFRATSELTEASGMRRDEHAGLQQLLAKPDYHRFAEQQAATLPIITQLTDGTAEQVGEHAARYQQLLTERAASIAADLDDVAEHQRLVVKQLVAVARKALQLLRTLQRRSQMPGELAGWSHRRFLTIVHDDPPEDETALADRMGRIVDRIISGTVDLDGHTLTFEAARAAVGDAGFRVTILKPHQDLRRDPVDISELGGFSGGQRLTAAVALFLAMLNLRLSEAGQTSSTRSVLLLDNPFGKSSADTFVQLQCQLAHRLNVQLVYTTAVKDLGALSHFHRVVRLAHRRHTGTGRLHVVVDEQAAAVSSLAAAALSRRDRPEGDGTRGR